MDWLLEGLVEAVVDGSEGGSSHDEEGASIRVAEPDAESVYLKSSQGKWSQAKPSQAKSSPVQSVYVEAGA